MLLIGNGKGDALAGLQNLTILVAAPFTLVMIGMCVALMRDLREDPMIVRREFGIEAVESAVIEGMRSTQVTSRSGSAPAAAGSPPNTTTSPTLRTGPAIEHSTGLSPRMAAQPTNWAAVSAQPQATVTPAPPCP